MIKITVELVSAVSRDRDRLLGVGMITNRGVHAQDPRFCDYDVWLSKMAPKERQAWKSGTTTIDVRDLVEQFEGTVENFDRQRRGCWDLLYLALHQLVSSRNPATMIFPTTSRRLRIPK